MQRVVRVDQNPMLESSWHLEVSTIEMRKNEPRLIFGLQHEWDGDAEADFDLLTEGRYRIRLDQNTIATSSRDDDTRLPDLERLLDWFDVTAARKLCLCIDTRNRLSHASDDCAGRQLY